MKRIFASAILLALFVTPGFAAKNSQSITLAHTVTVGATKLPAGDYKITWTGTGSDVQVTLEQKGAFHPASVTAPARLTEEKNDHTQLTTNQQGDVLTLQSVQLKGVSLQFTTTPASGQ